MKIHLVTIGKPKLDYARAGWEDYLARLKRLHTIRVTHLSDKYANDTARIMTAVQGTYVVVLEIEGAALTSRELAKFLRERELAAHEVSFVVGGPEGLPQPVRDAADYQWRLSKLTLPHDLAMVVVCEALYRASTINIGRPYHK